MCPNERAMGRFFGCYDRILLSVGRVLGWYTRTYGSIIYRLKHSKAMWSTQYILAMVSLDTSGEYILFI